MSCTEFHRSPPDLQRLPPQRARYESSEVATVSGDGSPGEIRTPVNGSKARYKRAVELYA